MRCVMANENGDSIASIRHLFRFGTAERRALEKGKQGGVLLDREGKSDLRPDHAPKRLDLLPEDRLDVLHVAGPELQPVSIVARDGATLLNVQEVLDLVQGRALEPGVLQHHVCLLYTSDAADDLLCVDLGG